MELSVVLVVIGLIAGGIVAAQSLIHSSELNSIVKQYQEFSKATQLFRDKYNYLPGDMPNATDFWGAADVSAVTCRTTPTVNNKTCNGDGDGKLGAYEMLRFWQQLVAAGLVSGNYTGIGSGGFAYKHVAGENAPGTSRSSSVWGITWIGETSGDALAKFAGSYDNTFIVAKEPTGSSGPNGGFFTSKDVWEIDNKIDDGKPAVGKVRIYRWADSGCTIATSETDMTATYNLSNNSTNCGIYFPGIEAAQ